MSSLQRQAAQLRASTTIVANVAVLNYKNPRIAQRLVGEAGLNQREAEDLFKDTLRFLSLFGNGFDLSPPARVDLGWHHFILHTQDYAKFCADCFGRFIHHEPGSAFMASPSRLDLAATVALAEGVFGPLSRNWNMARGMTCGSMGC